MNQGDANRLFDASGGRCTCGVDTGAPYVDFDDGIDSATALDICRRAEVDASGESGPHNDWAWNNDHRTVSVPLKTIAVDVGIEPVVRWLNSMDSVFTLHSCQGDRGDHADATPGDIRYSGHPAYVIFMSRHEIHCRRVREAILEYVTTHRDMLAGLGPKIETSYEKENGHVSVIYRIEIPPKMLSSFGEFVNRNPDNDQR